MGPCRQSQIRGKEFSRIKIFLSFSPCIEWLKRWVRIKNIKNSITCGFFERKALMAFSLLMSIA